MAEAPRPPVRRARWLWVIVLILVAVGILAIWASSGGSGTTDRRASALVFNESDVAQGRPLTDVRRTVPPIDVGAVERGAQAASLGQIPMPASREVATFTLVDTREEITEAVLVYDNVEEAASLDRLAAPLLRSALGLTEGSLDLQGTSDARTWTGQGYQVATFRVGGIVMVVATNSADPAELMRLAEMARDKAVREAAEMETPTAPAGTA